MRGFSYLFVLQILFFGSRASAQSIHFEPLTAADGLSQGMIHAMLQDRQGLLWFGTRDGLNRYDGYHFEVFQNDPFNPFSPSDNIITCLLEDHEGRIWAGTENNGVSILDPGSGRFYQIGTGAGKLSHQTVITMTKTADGAVWVGTSHGANRIVLPKNLPANSPDLAGVAQIEQFFWDGADSPGFPPSNQIATLLADCDQKSLWCITGRRGFRLDLKTGKQQDFFHCDAGNQSGCSLNTLGLCQSPDGTIWATMPDRFFRVRAGENQPMQLPYPNLQGSFKKTVSILADAEGNLFFTTLGSMFRLPATAIADGRLPQPADFEFLPAFSNEAMYAASLLSDRQGLLWLGSNGYGLLKYRPKSKQFDHFLQNISLRSLRVDGRGRVFFWSWIEQVRSFDLRNRRIEPPLLPIENYWHYDCLPTADGSLWLLARARESQVKGSIFVKINAQNLRPEAFFPVEIVTDQFSQIAEDPAGILWANGANSQLVRFDPRNGQSQVIDFSGVTGFNENSFNPRFDREGRFWLGTPHGLLRGLPRGDGGFDFSVFRNNPADRSTLAANTVLCTLDDPARPSEQIWVGTKGGGLHLMDKKSGKISRRFTTAEGLPNNVIYGILADRMGNLWMSSNSGLCQFNPQSVHFQNFSTADGLQSDEFNTISFASDPASGRLFFGGVNGLTAFDPAQLAPPDSSPVVRITGLKIHNRPARVGDGVLEKSLEMTEKITLPFSKNQVTVEFAAMDFTTPSKNQYRYRLIGAGKDWTEATTSNSATYANLAPGKYIFEVVTGGSRGVWNGATARLEIEVSPPWWRSNLAYLCYFLLLAGAGWRGYQFQINRIKLQNERDFEHREALRLAELDRMKTEFFSSVTHEFRTPLTLILEPARQILKEKTLAAAHPNLHLIENNANRLLRYVNQLLDLGKIEHRQMSLDLRRGNLAETLRPVFEEFLPTAKKMGVALEFEADDALPDSDFDSNKVDQIVQNLLSNALKFTPAGGKIELKILFQPVENQLEIRVSDTGAGISAADLPRVFERYFQSAASVENAESRGGRGTGIGLALVKEFAEMMGGRVAVQSELGKGSVFSVWMPVAAAATNFEKNAVSAVVAAAADFSNFEKIGSQNSPQIHLLLVEDNPELQQFIKQSLPKNWQIETADDGEQGIQKALELLPDAVISDVMMPRRDGLELTDFLKNDPRTSHLPIVLLSAKSALESRLAGLRRGADVYLTKPFHSEELIANVENLVATRQRLRDVFSKSLEKTSVLASAAEVFEPAENDFLKNLLEVVEQNLDNSEMSADDFAKSVFMSRSQLHRKLTALTGQSLGDFVKNHRLDRARDLLQIGELAVQDIAARTGFVNVKHFSTQFRERFGMPPSRLKTSV